MESKVAGALLQCVYNGSISMSDMEIERRPYHKNCNCALHRSNKNCSNLCPQRRMISVPIKQLWKEYKNILRIHASYMTKTTEPCEDPI
ncbi:hypothetical protein AQUCO_01600115v1 [Aquilegia coerulea]|uniref:Uncharacterized protein n=1 Tax=Aquilegia coerulea TaxID=218851 RepID=A0A2G5DQE6_AQUCA|nr:hypothetical protein AQUCO_01600115v1 [Aquilegia coerulea]